ncbi:MAG: hypothetical protein H6679_03955 [Epsilonproteobacteria bacterium]|nr:hypothetical protein [Campylobacterota bacterium]
MKKLISAIALLALANVNLYSIEKPNNIPRNIHLRLITKQTGNDKTIPNGWLTDFNVNRIKIDDNYTYDIIMRALLLRDQNIIIKTILALKEAQKLNNSLNAALIKASNNIATCHPLKLDDYAHGYLLWRELESMHLDEEQDIDNTLEIQAQNNKLFSHAKKLHTAYQELYRFVDNGELTEETLHKYIKNHKIDINFPLWQGKTLLVIAIEKTNSSHAHMEQRDTIKELIKLGANISHVDQITGKTLLHYVVQANLIEVAQALITANNNKPSDDIQVNAVCKQYHKAIDHAFAPSVNIPMLKVLLNSNDIDLSHTKLSHPFCGRPLKDVILGDPFLNEILGKQLEQKNYR